MVLIMPLKNEPTADQTFLIPFQAAENIPVNQEPTPENIPTIPFLIPEKKLTTAPHTF